MQQQPIVKDAPSESLDQTITKLFQDNQGVIFLNIHDDLVSFNAIIGLVPVMKQQGVKYFFVEKATSVGKAYTIFNKSGKIEVIKALDDHCFLFAAGETFPSDELVATCALVA